MAAAKTEKTPVERVELFVPRTGNRDETDAYVSVNGVNYIMPRGQTHSVPKPVYDEFMRSERAKERYLATVASRISKG